MAGCSILPPEYSIGIDARGRLICQEDNLEPGVIKELDNYFLNGLTAKVCHNFTLAANASNTPISFGSITNAKVLFIFAHSPIEYKIGSIGAPGIPVCPFALHMASNGGITELYLTNLGVATNVEILIAT